MLLVIDVGNTNTNFGVFDNDVLKASFHINTKIPRTSDEFGIILMNLLIMKGINIKDIDGCMTASVVPGVMYSLNSCIIKYVGITPIAVEAGIRTGVKIHTANPREIGADRIVDAAAAFELYGGPVMVADFGTATTYDLITADGTLEAGLTCPGIRLSANALWTGTAKLPEIEIALPDTILAKDTVSSMQAGLVYGCIGQTEYIIRKVREEARLDDMKVVATGGLGKIIADATDAIDVYDPKLTMKGLNIIYKKNVKK